MPRTAVKDKVNARGGRKNTVGPPDITGTGALASQAADIFGVFGEGLIVDDVATELELATHPDIKWYPNFEQLTSAQIPGDWWTAVNDWPAGEPYGVNVRHTSAPEFGVGAYRAGSLYAPDHCLVNGEFGACVAPLGGDGAPWLMINKYTRRFIGGGGASTSFLGTEPIYAVRTRWTIMMERDVLTGMTEPDGIKLQGINTKGGKSTTMRLKRHSAGQTRWQLQGYWDLSYLGTSIVVVTLPEFIYPDYRHGLEQYLQMNSAPGVADGVFQVWWDDKLIRDDQNVIISNFTDDEILSAARGQIFHGGQSWVPSFQIHAQIATYAVSYGASVVRRIGKPKLVQPVLVRDLNNGLWTSPNVNGTGWNQAGTNGSQRTDMQYSNAHQHTDGRQLEFSRALHEDNPGDNTGVRWAEFDAHRPPMQGYYWSNADTQISEHDNFPTCYLPWKGWVLNTGATTEAFPRTGIKIIRIDGTPSAIFRNLDASGLSITDFMDVTYPTGTGLGFVAVADRWWKQNHNPACWVNPSGTITGWWGGGYSSSFPGSGNGSVFKILDDNPNYPATSSKQLRLRVIRPTGQPSPTHMRHMVQIGDWLYWGGGGINPDGATGTSDLTRNDEFYRIYVPDLANNVFTQEAITAATPILAYPGLSLTGNCVRFNLLCADQIRKWLIYMNINGVYRYKVPIDDGNDGTWEGPFTFGMTSNEWAEAISENAVNTGSTPNWHGLIGTHRADLGRNGMTFFRYNNSKRWNRIEWSS